MNCSVAADAFTAAELERIFDGYGDPYAHLLQKMPLEAKSEQQRRRALADYLNLFASEEDEERRALAEALCKNPTSADVRDQFIQRLTTDQYFEEPLMHILDLGWARFVAKYIDTRNKYGRKGARQTRRSTARLVFLGR